MSNQTQEALKMAIEALDAACYKIKKWTKGGKWIDGEEASAKCKEALEQPAPSWQGLTAQEIASIPLDERTVQTVERLLKEKNT